MRNFRATLTPLRANRRLHLFSKILEEDLFEYVTELRRRNSWQYRLDIPKLLPADWTIAKRAGLLPDEGEYVNWLRGFYRLPTRGDRLRTYSNDGRARSRLRGAALPSNAWLIGIPGPTAFANSRATFVRRRASIATCRHRASTPSPGVVA
jgi:hypothetical protein